MWIWCSCCPTPLWWCSCSNWHGGLLLGCYYWWIFCDIGSRSFYIWFWRLKWRVRLREWLQWGHCWDPFDGGVYFFWVWVHWLCWSIILIRLGIGEDWIFWISICCCFCVFVWIQIWVKIFCFLFDFLFS